MINLLHRIWHLGYETIMLLSVFVIFIVVINLFSGEKQ